MKKRYCSHCGAECEAEFYQSGFDTDTGKPIERVRIFCPKGEPKYILWGMIEVGDTFGKIWHDEYSMNLKNYQK